MWVLPGILVALLSNVLSFFPPWVSLAVIAVSVVGLLILLFTRPLKTSIVPLVGILVMAALYFLPGWVSLVLLLIPCAVLALLILVLPLRASATAQYDQSGVLVRAGFGFLRIKVYQSGEKEKKRKKKDKPKKEKPPKEKGGTMRKLRAGLSIIGPILKQVRRRLLIADLTLHYTASTSDAAMTALAYGGAHMAVSQILPIIRQQWRVKREDVQIRASFDEVEDVVFLRVKVSISVWGALCLGLFVLKKVRESGLIGKKEIVAQKGAV